MKVFVLFLSLFFVLNVVISQTYATEEVCSIRANCKTPSIINTKWMRFVTPDDTAKIEADLVNKFDEMRTDFAKLEGRLERSEKVEFEMNFEITLMEKKNSETESGLRNGMDRMKKEVEDGKTQLNGAMKQITSLEKTNGEMRNEMDSIKKEAEEDKGKLNGAMKQISVLEKKNAEMERMKKQTNEKITSLEKTNSEMRNEIDTVKKEAEGNKGKMNVAMKVLCPVIYENKCFIPVIDRDVNYDGAVAACKSRGGHLANIYSQTHMDDVMKYIREYRMGGSIWQRFRLGLKYDPKAKKLILRGGTDAPAGLKWYTGYPITVEDNANYAGRTNVILYVKSDQSLINQYLINFLPSDPSSVLCEIE